MIGTLRETAGALNKFARVPGERHGARALPFRSIAGPSTCVEINQCVGCSDTATLSSRRRVDGVEVDAAIQDERAVNLISPQVCARAYLEDVVTDVVFGRVAKPREALRTCVGNQSVCRVHPIILH